MQSIRSSVVLGVLQLEEGDVDLDLSAEIDRSLTSGAHSVVAYVDEMDPVQGFLVSVVDANEEAVSGPVTFTVNQLLIVKPWDNTIKLFSVDDFDPLFNSDRH